MNAATVPAHPHDRRPVTMPAQERFPRPTPLPAGAHPVRAGSEREFVLAGRAVFTLRSRRTGDRFTYQVKARDISDPRTVWFVSVLTGAQNDSDYSYLGFINAEEVFVNGGVKSRIGYDAPSAKGFAWFWRHVDALDLEQVEVWHEGACGRCGRALTDPESIASGLGPVCRGRS